MTTLGVFNDLKVLSLSPMGAFLDCGSENEALLPAPEVPKDCVPGQILRAFLYVDAQDRLTATLRKPLAQLGDVAHLKVTRVDKTGAMLAWGLPQDLHLPRQEMKWEQRQKIKVGQKLLVILFLDEDGRLAASTRLEQFLGDEAEGLQAGEKVSLVVGDPTDLGVRVVVNHLYWGMVHRSDIFGTLSRGETREGYVKALREDKKLDIVLNPPGYAKVDAIAQGILDQLASRGGFLPLTDKSAPEAIYAQFGISKKAFKLSIGALYKARRIAIEAEGIRLVAKA